MDIVHDYRRLAAAFERDAEKTVKTVEEVVTQGAEDIAEYATDNHRFKRQSGDTERSIKSKQLTRACAIAYTDSPVAIMIHRGTRPHVIRPKTKTILRWPGTGPGGAATFFFKKEVHHPGTKPDPFLFNAADAKAAEIAKRMEKGIEKVFSDG